MELQQVETVGNEQRRWRERERRIDRVRDGALDRNRNGIGWKRPSVKTDTRVFQINRLSIKRDKSLGGGG